MPSKATVSALIEMVEGGQFIASIERFYAPSATMQENLLPPRVGIDALVTHERRFLKMWSKAQARCLGEPLIQGDLVVINWAFTFTTASGAIAELDELARQRWDGDRIVEERFYYDPAQFALRQPGKPPPTG